jgi:hypothetical protein
MTNPAIDAIEPHDPGSPGPGCGRSPSTGLARRTSKDPYVSPLTET